MLFCGYIAINEHHIGVFVVYCSMSGITFIFFLFSWLRNPGYVKKSKKLEFIQLLRAFDPILLCPVCEVFKTKRSRHCNFCNQCVEKFDHHCLYINNCVGQRNHSAFLLFTIFETLTLGISFALMLV